MPNQHELRFQDGTTLYLKKTTAFPDTPFGEETQNRNAKGLPLSRYTVLAAIGNDLVEATLVAPEHAEFQAASKARTLKANIDIVTKGMILDYAATKKATGVTGLIFIADEISVPALKPQQASAGVTAPKA